MEHNVIGLTSTNKKVAELMLMKHATASV